MHQRCILFTDLDGTILGDDQAVVRFATWYSAQSDCLAIVYNSGRFFHSVAESIKSTDLPDPHAVIGGVGTDISLYPSGEFIEQWHQVLRKNWDHRRVRQLLLSVPELELQPEQFQSPYKVSCYLYNADGDQLRNIEARLRKSSLDVSIIYSSKRDLDVLPARADRGTASAFLASIWEIDTDRVMVSGDSGNDLALFQQGFRGIVVGNAHEELKSLDGGNVYHAQGTYADGVIEGLEYWLKKIKNSQCH